MNGRVIYLGQKKTMAHAKMMWLVADFIGFPLAIWGFILNLDNIKSALIALLVLAYGCVRLYFYIVQKRQSVREKEIDLESKQIALWWEKQKKLKEEAITAKFRK